MTRMTVVIGAQATKHDADTTPFRPITNPHDTHTDIHPVQRATRSAAVGKLCPTCRGLLDGGPVLFRCEPCGKAVHAADLDHETHAPLTRAPFATGPAELGRAA